MRVRGHVGMAGVAIDSVEDMKVIERALFINFQLSNFDVEAI